MYTYIRICIATCKYLYIYVYTSICCDLTLIVVEESNESLGRGCLPEPAHTIESHHTYESVMSVKVFASKNLYYDYCIPKPDDYGVASVSRIDKIIGLFCKRAL